MRTLEHWDDCNIQIKFGEGENDTQVLVKIFDEYCGSFAGQECGFAEMGDGWC